MIHVEDVAKSFQQGSLKVDVLNALSLDAARGEHLSIQGVSGSGKSTLLHLLAGLDYPDSGTIVVDNTPLTSLPPAELTRFRRERVGIIFQFYNLIPTLTARENVSMAMEILDTPPPDLDERVDLILEEVGLTSHRNAFPQELSGGQQQRVAIARALVKNPAVLYADEPTGNLDEETGKRVMDLIRTINEKWKMTVIVVTHDPEVAAMGDRCLNLHHGALAAAQ